MYLLFYYLQTTVKATNVFHQAHNVNRNERAEILGSGFHGCTIWFTGTPLYFIIADTQGRHDPQRSRY